MVGIGLFCFVCLASLVSIIHAWRARQHAHQTDQLLREIHAMSADIKRLLQK